MLLGFGIISSSVSCQSLHEISLRDRVASHLDHLQEQMMQASSSDEAIHPALAACTSLDSVELYDVDLDGGSGAVAPATSASSLSPTLRTCSAHRSTSSPPTAAMTGTSTSIDIDNRDGDEYPEPASTRPQHEEQYHHTQQPPSTMKALHKRTLSSYNLISPALEKVPSSDSAP